MKILNQMRGSGKTVMLIKMSYNLQIPIVCATQAHKREVKKKAENLGLTIPEPIYVKELGGGYDNILIDELDATLSTLLNKNIICATRTDKDLNQLYIDTMY